MAITPPHHHPSEPLGPLIELTHHRWMLAVLAACERAEGGGLKYVTFLHRLGISRESLGRTLAAGIEGGWLMHNPGAGHPLRPEYILTPRGRAVAAEARRLLNTLRRMGVEEACLRKWSLPVLAAISMANRLNPAGIGFVDPRTVPRGARFADLGRLLPEATGRALALTLRELQEADLLEREVLDTFPPTTRYSLKRRAWRLAYAGRALARAAGLGISRRTPTDGASSSHARRATSA